MYNNPLFSDNIEGDIMAYIILFSVIAYFAGSINPSVLISKKVYGKDIRTVESKNAGATNMMRAFGKKAGLTVFLLDFSKGFLSVLIAKAAVRFFDAPYEAALFAGFFAVLGHIFPVFFRFRGGKGVATLAGAAFALMPFITAALLVLFAVIASTTKIVSLASGICAAIFPIAAYFLAPSHNNKLFVFGCCCAALMIIKHLPNITRLLDGEERKI